MSNIRSLFVGMFCLVTVVNIFLHAQFQFVSFLHTVTRSVHRIPDEILNDVLLQKAISQVKNAFVFLYGKDNIHLFIL